MKARSANTIGCAALAAALLLGAPALRAGWIEDRPDGSTVIHVTVFLLPDPNRTDTFNRAETAAMRAFIEGFPRLFAERCRDRYRAAPEKYGRHNWDRVEVALEKFTGIRVEGVEADLLAIAGGMAPDVLDLNFRKSDNYIRNGFLYPLDKPEDGYLAGLTREEVDFLLHPKLLPVVRRKGPDGREHTWMLPYGGLGGKVLLYRRDLFDAAGIEYPTAQWTWDDMLAAARKLTDPRRGTTGIAFGRGKHESWYWINFLWSAGGDVMTLDERTDEWRCVFDTREAAVALDFYTRLCTERWVDADGKVRRGYADKDSREISARWERGEIGMLLGGIGEKVFSTINPELTGMAPVPLGPTGQRGGELNCGMQGLFAEIRSPAVRDAAWEYLRFHDSREALEIKTRIMVEGGFGQFVNPRYLRMFGYPEIERLAPAGWAETFQIAIDSSRPEPYGRNSNLAYSLMTLPIQQAETLALRDALPAGREARLDTLRGLLQEACRRANEEMIGLVPPRERTLRRVVATAFLLALGVVFAFVFRRIAETFTPPAEPGHVRRAWAFRKYAWAYVLLLPAVLSILVWNYTPLLRGSVMAFFDYRILGPSTWVGVDNFGDMLFDRYWWAAVWNSLRYSFLVVTLTFLPPIVLAILLQEVPRGRILFRTLFYLPAVVSGLVTILLWKQFYEATERGVLNAVVLRIPAAGFVAAGLALLFVAVLFARRLLTHDLRWQAWAFVCAGVVLLGACAGMARPILFPLGEPLRVSLAHFVLRLGATTPEPYRWLSDPHTAMLSCVIPMVWAGMGPGCLIYLAALKGIPEDYYEAADLDGAGFIDKILFVVFPSLKALILINFVGVFIGAWYGASGNILAMTGGAADTEVAGLHIWYKAFTFLKFGPAAAGAWMLGFLMLGFTVHQLRMLSKVEFRTQGAK